MMNLRPIPVLGATLKKPDYKIWLDVGDGNGNAKNE